jgi:sulfite reductase (NADPH) flavoprotein alpha-component
MKSSLHADSFPQEDARFSNNAEDFSELAGDIRASLISDRSDPPSRAPVHILYGTQTGNAEFIAQDIAEAALLEGFEPITLNLDGIDPTLLSTMERIIVVTSTYGDGQMPDSAQSFWEAFSADDAPRLDRCVYGVLALGDINYDTFCQAGKQIDNRFEQLGARRVIQRADCDVDFQEMASAWATTALALFSKNNVSLLSDDANRITETPASHRSHMLRKSLLINRRRLSSEGSGKDIHHLRIGSRR